MITDLVPRAREHSSWELWEAIIERQRVRALRLMERLLVAGNHPAIATHDERLINRVLEIVRAQDIAADRFDFEMLFGVRRDLQLRLVKAGYRVRVYLPYGSEWYPYLVRRLAERPANLGFFVRSMVSEALAGRRDGHP